MRDKHLARGGTKPRPPPPYGGSIHSRGRAGRGIVPAMVTCPICGTRSRDGSANCAACGNQLPVSGPSAVEAGSGRPTPTSERSPPRAPPRQPIVRVSGSGNAATVEAGSKPRPDRMKQTMLGVAPAPNPPAPPRPGSAARPATLQARRTMLGVAPAPNAPGPPRPTRSSNPPPEVSEVPPGSVVPSTVASPGVPPGAGDPNARPRPDAPAWRAPAAVTFDPSEQQPEEIVPRVTMAVGTSVPPPGAADGGQVLAAPELPAPAPSPFPAAAREVAPPRDLLPRTTAPGEANPGNGLRPWVVPGGADGPQGRRGRSERPRGTEPPPPTPKSPSQAPTLISATSSKHAGRGRVWWFAWALGAALLVPVVAGGALALWLRGRHPVRAEVAVDPGGAEVLLLQCARCVDGTIARVGGATSHFHAHQASVALRDRLAVGDNELALTLTRPDGTTEHVRLVVPVDFRIEPDPSGLAASPPALRVKVDAAPGAAVVVNGAPLAIGPDGRGVAEVGVLSELTGPSPNPATLDKNIPYTVTPQRAAPASGELRFQMPITTLVVEAPGESVVLEGPHFWLTGRTRRGGVVSVGGRPITVDESGGFVQLMSVSAEGETTIFVRADAVGHAPRLVPLRVRRVHSLRAEAARLDGQVTRSYAELRGRLASGRSAAVGLAATILEAQTSGHRTTILVEIGEGCATAPCLAVVVHGARVDPLRGEVWRVYGRAERTAKWPERSGELPRIDADFLLPPQVP